jgi:outer membrane protein assembly factor BamA
MRALLPLLLLLSSAPVGADDGEVRAVEVKAVEAKARASAAPAITRVSVRVDRPQPGEGDQLERYLSALVGEPASDEVAERAQRRLLALGRYSSAVCRLGGAGGSPVIKCGVSRARTIRRVLIEGLPQQMLETALRKRLFLRPGEVLNRADASGRDRVTRQRERIEDYLVREGFYGARVEVLTPPVSRTADVDVLVRVQGGSFVTVRNIEVKEPYPLKGELLRDRLGTMCGWGEGLLNFFDTFRVACFTKERLRDTVERLDADLRERGYPEGRIVVREHFVEGEESGACGWSKAQRARFAEQRLKVPPRCVDLEVRVDRGPHLAASFVLHDDEGELASPPPDPGRALVEWAAGATRFMTEPISHGLQMAFAQPLRASDDTDLRFEDLAAQLTFTTSRATDETEVELSRQALLRYLAHRGYLNARVEVRRQDSDERVDVVFHIWPDAPAAVRHIELAGAETLSADEVLDAVELVTTERTLVRDSGFPSERDLQDDAERILQFYKSKGFLDARVEHQTTVRGERLFVVFHIDEGEAYTLSELRLVGGHPALTPAVLAAVAHCGGGLAARQKRPPVVAGDCAGSPFLPEELPADSQRVINVYARAGFPYVKADVALAPEWGPAGPIIEVRVWEPSLSGDEAAPEAPPPPLPVARGEVFLEGNFRTARGPILQEMGLRAEGEDRLRPERVSEGISKLRRTGLFSRVGYRYVGKEDHSDTLHLVVDVEERNAGAVEGALSFSTDDLFVLGAEWRDRNFLGLMLDVGLRTDLGLFVGRRSEVAARLRWPRIRGSDVDFTVEPRAQYTDHPGAVPTTAPPSPGPVVGKAVWRSLSRRRIFGAGGHASLDWRVSPRRLPGLVTGLDYELRAEWDDPTATRLAPLSPEAFASADGLLLVFEEAQLRRVSVFAPRIRYSNINNLFDPTDGWSGELTVQLGSPWWLAERNAVVALGRTTSYWPVGRDLVLAANARAWAGMTFVVPGDTSSILLQPQLLSLGGDRTVRGYLESAPFGLPDLPAQVADASNPQVAGLLTLVGAQANLELRYTLVRNFGLGDLKVAAFVDAGVVATNPEALLGDPTKAVADWAAADQLGLGFGVGLRQVLPVGPLSLDIAAAPLRGSGAWHLQFGYAF